MDREIKLEIAIGVILIIVVIIGGFIWLGGAQQKQIQAVAQSLKNQTASSSTAKNSDTGNTVLPVSDVQAPIQVEKTPTIAGLQVALPDDWILASQAQENMYNVFTLKSRPETSLVLSVSKNNADNIRAFKEERTGTEYTEINGGEIFKFTGCGVLGNTTCNGAIVNDDVYSFTWSVVSNEPILENQALPQSPQSFSGDAIWNVLKTIVAK